MLVSCKEMFYKELNALKTNERVFLEDNVMSIARKITHVFDCELFCVGKQKFLRECSVLNLHKNVIRNYHVYYLHEELKWSKTIAFQVNKLHGLPLIRYNKTSNFYTQDKCIRMLDELFALTDNCFVAYKGGTVERELCQRFGIACINLELLKCPKFELLEKIGKNCSHHLNNKTFAYHCSKV